MTSSYLPIIRTLGIMNQYLISRYLDFGMLQHARKQLSLDVQLYDLLLYYKQNMPLAEQQHRAAGITHYIWHTQEDDKVRPSHAANDGKIFAWDNPPPTGNPGEDYGCRCWAEPYINDPPIQPVYPVEVALGLLTLGQAILAVRAALLGREAIALTSGRIGLAAKAIEEYLGGPGELIRNKSKDTVLIKGDKKIRLILTILVAINHIFKLSEKRLQVNGRMQENNTDITLRNR